MTQITIIPVFLRPDTLKFVAISSAQGLVLVRPWQFRVNIPTVLSMSAGETNEIGITGM